MPIIPVIRHFTQACDELGLMLWLEIPLTGSTSEDPAFMENCINQLTEMIEQHYNNPSVILWGIGNESDRSGAAEAKTNHVFESLVKHAKKLDPTRPVTGCNFQYQSNQKIVEIYSPQDWSGWYGGEINNYKPNSIIGEYGADVHFPNHTEEKFDIAKNYQAAQKPGFWSQEYGALLHEYKVSMGESTKENFPGHCVWVAFDFASPRTDRTTNPIPYMNQKGLVMHDHKTKKDAYYFYQSMYRIPDEFPMVYIVSHSWTDRWKEPGKKDIWVYSNCDSVELFNGFERYSLGKRIKNAGPRGDTRFQWDAADVKYNVLYAEGWFNNRVVARDTIILKNLPKAD
jgi:beta-galactosidase